MVDGDAEVDAIPIEYFNIYQAAINEIKNEYGDDEIEIIHDPETESMLYQ